jgi:hypothetical protein
VVAAAEAHRQGVLVRPHSLVELLDTRPSSGSTVPNWKVRSTRRSIELGKIADFVVLVEDRLANVRNLRGIEMTIKCGYCHNRCRFLKETNGW